MQKLTKEQAIIISAYTGFTACNFGNLHEAVEKKLGRPIWTHQFGNEALMEEIRDAFREDFLAICYKDCHVTETLRKAASPTTQPAKAVEREQERIAFKDAHRYLELYEVPDAWGRPMFKHSHVEASWLGWLARASHGQASASNAASASLDTQTARRTWNRPHSWTASVL